MKQGFFAVARQRRLFLQSGRHRKTGTLLVVSSGTRNPKSVLEYFIFFSNNTNDMLHFPWLGNKEK
jgi:hypothetical protein